MTTDIHSLLDKYFEGKTSGEEEQILRRYFAQDNLPEELEEFAPIFNFFGNEALAATAINEANRETVRNAKPKSRLGNLWAIAALAASVLIAVLIISHPKGQSSMSKGNFVWVDGKRITEPATVQKYAEASLGKVQPETDLLEEQLSFMLE